MKRNWIAALLLMAALAVFCTACGGGNDAPAADAQATKLPTVTAPPEGAEDAEDAMLTADDNKAPDRRDRASYLAAMSEDQRKVEEELIGATVEDLYKAIGKPKSTEYTTSCLVADGEDGTLYYDGFYVSTTRFPNGTEYVMGTDFAD